MKGHARTRLHAVHDSVPHLTLCGQAFADTATEHLGAKVATNGAIVTCVNCLRVEGSANRRRRVASVSTS